MTSRKTLVSAAVAIAVAVPALSAVALTATSTVLSPDAAPAAQPMTVNAAYECANTFNKDITDLPVNADVEATRTSAERVDLAVSTGKLDFDLGSQTPNVALASHMDLVVDGSPAHVSGSSTVTLDPDNPPDFPVATGTAKATGTTLTLVPGDLTIDIKVAGFPVTLTCTVKGTAPTVTVPVDDPDGLGATTPEPTTAPAPRVKPGLTVKLTKKVQRVGKKPARVVVRVQRPKGAASRPAGTVRVKVGQRVLTKRTVTGATHFRVALPRKLAPGRHRVTVKFTPAKKSGYLPRTTKVRVRVKR